MSYTIEDKSYMIHTLTISGCKFHSDLAGVSRREIGSDQDLLRINKKFQGFQKQDLAGPA